MKTFSKPFSKVNNNHSGMCNFFYTMYAKRQLNDDKALENLRILRGILEPMYLSEFEEGRLPSSNQVYWYSVSELGNKQRVKLLKKAIYKTIKSIFV